LVPSSVRMFLISGDYVLIDKTRHFDSQAARFYTLEQRVEWICLGVASDVPVFDRTELRCGAW